MPRWIVTVKDRIQPGGDGTSLIPALRGRAKQISEFWVQDQPSQQYEFQNSVGCTETLSWEAK